MRQVASTLLFIALWASAASAQERLEGSFDLTGTRAASAHEYAGEARVHAEGGDLVLAAWIDGAARPLLRAPGGASSNGPWTFTGATQAGVSGTLDGLLGGAPPGASVALRVDVRRATGGGFEARVLEDGRVIARERLAPSVATGLTIVAFAPERARFCPYRADGPSTVAVRYAVDPPGAPCDVEARIVDGSGAEVARSTQRGVRADGAGGTFTWDGRDAKRACVDARRSPYRITLRATRDRTTVASAAVEVVVVPRLDACVVVSSVDGAEATSANKVVAHGADVHLVALVRAVVAGARPEEPGRTERAWFVAPGAGVASATLPAPVGRVTLATWDEARWPALALAWQEVRARGLHSPAYRATQNATRLTRDGEFTNVTSNGEDEGAWLGRDTLEYEHVDRGAGPTLSAHRQPGTLRYRVDADLADPALRAPVGSPGRRDPRATTATALRSGLLDGFSAALGGAAPQVHRISRRGPSPHPLLSHLEAYRGVPWLYGSLGPQVQEYVGFDCADLVFAAARRAGLTTRNAFTNANNLCRTYCKAVGRLPVVRFDESFSAVDARTGSSVDLPAAGGVGEARPGDVVFFDWDGDGDWDHTTVLWEAPSGRIDLSSTLAWAHHEPGSVDGVYIGALSELIHPGTQPTTKMAIRRF